MPNGMELVAAIRAGQVTPPSGIKTLGLDRLHAHIQEVEPGRVRIVYPIDAEHNNLEGAVICSWLTALADQALFFAGATLCRDGQTTRMEDMRVSFFENLVGGMITLDALVVWRNDERLYCRCGISNAQGGLAADTTATMRIIEAAQ